LKGWLSDDDVLKGEGTLTLKPGRNPQVLPVLTFTPDGLSARAISVPLAALLRPSGRLCVIQLERPSSIIQRVSTDRIVFGAMVVSTAIVTLNYNNGLVGFTQQDVAAAGSSSAACAAVRSCRDVETYISESNSCSHPCSSRWFFKYNAATLQCSATSVIPYTIVTMLVALVSLEVALAVVNSKAGTILCSSPPHRFPQHYPRHSPYSICALFCS
jgi:hypothetical protein